MVEDLGDDPPERDAGVLARATEWAATTERCANQAFNITNGYLFRSNELWPKLARMFGMDAAPPLHMSLEGPPLRLSRTPVPPRAGLRSGASASGSRLAGIQLGSHQHDGLDHGD